MNMFLISLINGFPINRFLFLGVESSLCEKIDLVLEYLQSFLSIISIVAPIIVIILMVIDLVPIITSSDVSNIKEKTGMVTKRLILLVLLYFIPTIINLIFDMPGLSGLIGGCA